MVDVIRAEGRNGQISFDGAAVTITREGFVARSTHGRSEKRIPIATIGAVQYKPYSVMGWGFIKFSVTGESSNRTKLGSQSKDAFTDENAVQFTKSQQPQFEALRDAIQAAQSAPVPASAPDLTEQIAKLAALHQQGVLTDEEFATKKAQLLDRI